MAERIVITCDSPEVLYLSAKDKRLAKLISMVGEISYEPHDGNSYAFMVHEIIEQMLSVKAGRRIYDRLSLLCHGEVTPDNVDAFLAKVRYSRPTLCNKYPPPSKAGLFLCAHSLNALC